MKNNEISFSGDAFVVGRSDFVECDDCRARVTRFAAVLGGAIAVFESELTPSGTYIAGYPELTWKDELGYEHKYKDNVIAMRRLRPEEIEYARVVRNYQFATPHKCQVAEVA